MADPKSHTTIELEKLEEQSAKKLADNLREVLLARCNAHFDPESDEPFTVETVREYIKGQIASLSKLVPLEGMKVEMVETPPAQEAAERLAGEFDPNVVKMHVQVPRVVEFINIEFTVNPEPEK